MGYFRANLFEKGTEMNGRIDLCFILLSLFLFFVTSSSAIDCQEKGFLSDTLPCSNCALLDTLVGVSLLTSDCLECCFDDNQEEVKKYKKAVLEVCKCSFGTHPDLKNFIQKGLASNISNLEVKYVRGKSPTLKLTTQEGEQEMISVSSWSLDDYVEFFETQLT
eukprot:GCRY01001482.1.p1 GENE.GCRY01001482.1~~GCRY01001482.1.p1  ORF type:complete len:164 (-),score=25.43 GCRY01001482.1:105-596(-)